MEPLRKRPAAKPAVRGNDLARIHILAEQAGLIVKAPRVNGKKAGQDDRSAYEDLTRSLYHVASSAQLSFEQRSSYIAHLESLVRTRNPQAAKAKHEPDSHERRLLAEWNRLRDAGAVGRSPRALSAWLAGMGYPAHTKWHSTDQLNHAIEQAKQWLARIRREAATPSAPK